jgi:hypothetical protein
VRLTTTLLSYLLHLIALTYPTSTSNLHSDLLQLIKRSRMASLFMNPAECGPVNDLKSLGGRLDVDGRARRVSPTIQRRETYRSRAEVHRGGNHRTASCRTTSMGLRDHRDKLFR